MRACSQRVLGIIFLFITISLGNLSKELKGIFYSDFDIEDRIFSVGEGIAKIDGKGLCLKPVIYDKDKAEEIKIRTDVFVKGLKGILRGIALRQIKMGRAALSQHALLLYLVRSFSGGPGLRSSQGTAE